MRTTLSVIGVAIAVLAATLLAATGLGVVQTGQEKFDSADRDLWITGGPVEFAPGTVGGVQNSIRDSHRVADELRGREDVATVGTLLFQTVYASPNGSEYRTIAALGVPRSSGLSVTSGRGFPGDPHYADGNYTGPMTHEVLIDRRTASLFDIGVGDSLHVGGTITAADRHRFVVVGISPTGSQFLGVPTVSMPLSELQEITGKTSSDPATLITITTTESASVTAVQHDLERTYPQYTVRTNREQLRATVERQAVVLAGGTSLVALAILAGIALTLNALLSMLIQQARVYAALKSLGTSTTTLTLTALVQTLCIGLLGGGLGLACALPLATGLNHIIGTLVGFENVVRLTPQILLVGGGIALAMSLLSGALAGVYLWRMQPLELLRS
nr:ABC transporter permease [Haloplanus sp. XH21]